METETWNVIATFDVRGDAVQQFHSKSERVSELESGRWGCVMCYPAPGFWNITLEAQRTSGAREQGVVIEDVGVSHRCTKRHI